MSTRIVTSCQPHRVMSDVQGDNDTEQSSSSLSSSSSSLPVTPAGVQGSNKASPPLSVIGQPLDGAPSVVPALHFCFHSSSPGCRRSTTLPLSLWGPAGTQSKLPLQHSLVGRRAVTIVSSFGHCSRPGLSLAERQINWHLPAKFRLQNYFFSPYRRRFPACATCRTCPDVTSLHLATLR